MTTVYQSASDVRTEPAIGRAVVLTQPEPTPIADSLDMPLEPPTPEDLITGLVELARMNGHPDPDGYEAFLRAAAPTLQTAMTTIDRLVSAAYPDAAETVVMVVQEGDTAEIPTPGPTAD